MTRQTSLHEFTRAALAAGCNRDTIAAALAAAGWSGDEIRDSLAAWDSRPGMPPIPRRARTALTAGMALVEGFQLVALAMVATQLVALLVGLIELWLPATAGAMLRWQLDALRWPLAALVVFLPLWLWSDHRTRPAPGQRRPALSVWVGHLAVFLAALTLLGAALTIVYRFLSGDVTAAFALKSLAVALVAGLVILAMQERRHD